MYNDPYYLTLFLVFSIIAFMLIIDRNVSDYIILIFKMFKINVEKYFWMMKLHPKNPITNYMMKRRYTKIAEELHKELMQNPLD